MQAPELLRQDHETVTHLFGQIEATTDGRRRQELIDTIAEELEVHAQIEEEIFYPAVRSVSGVVGHAREEHARVRSLIGDVEGRDPASPEFRERVRMLQQAVSDHVAEEEKQMFAEARALGDDELARLGQQLHERKETLKTSIVQRGIRGLKLAAKKVA